VKLFVGGVLKDEYIQPFGIRGIKFDADKGFVLNGKQTKIKGVCCHQNHGGLGSAVPADVPRYRIRKLKEMGANAYRSHYPLSSAFLDICDEEGIMVMSENRLLSSERGDLEQLETMVRRDRNHPSVILYSIGNEEAQSQTTPQGARITRTMIERIKKLDPYTPVTMALLMWDLKNKLPYNDHAVIAGILKQLDVAGFNYQDRMWQTFRDEFPHQPFICTEQGTFKSTRGCYETDAEKCHLSIFDKNDKSYMMGAPQWHICRPDWVSGLFIWTGFDYYGEPTPFAWPAISTQFGAMDLCGYPKDFYWYYKAWWTDEDILHIFPHWNWNAGETVDVWAYYNQADEVELFLNGKSLGIKKKGNDDLHVWWRVAYEPGELVVISRKNGQEVLTRKIRTAGEPVAIRLTADRNKLCATGKDLSFITAEAIDKDGNVVPIANNLIRFSVEGPALIAGTDNGDPTGSSSLKRPERPLFNGKCLAVIQGKKQSGTIKVKAVAEGLKEAIIEVRNGK
jgi:beta-galactosidase